MFAATTTDTLSISDPAVLKKAPSSIPSCLDLIHAPTASSWSPDNAFLYLSSEHIIHRYDPVSNVLKDIYVHDFKPISHLIAKDRSSVIFSSEAKIHVLECDLSPRISQTFESQKSTVHSLSLSNDTSLLSSTSSESVHVHNLALGSHTVLKGVPTQGISAAIFHPHSRTRLLVAAGKQLLVYDTTRPSGPAKVITLNESASGTIVAIACSPFSKTLVAVATPTGFIGLIDLEKEKALFRTLSLKLPLTSIGFSPEGAAIYTGTETGKILLVDLRALDKPPKSIILSESGSSVQTISIQKKIKASPDVPIKTPANATTASRKSYTETGPSTRRTTGTTKLAAKPALSPARSRAATVGAAASPTTRRALSASKEGGPAATPMMRPLSKESKVLSPVRDPLGNSGSARDLGDELDELADRRRGKMPALPSQISERKPFGHISQRSHPSLNSAVSASKTSSIHKDAENPRKARTLPTSSSTSAVAARKNSMASIATSSQRSPLPSERKRTISSTSKANSDAISVVSGHSKSAKTTSATSTSSASHLSSPTSRPGSSLTSRTTHDSPPRRLRSMSNTIPRESRTPSPELPKVQEPITPMPARNQNKKKGMEVLGLGTPDVDRWIQAGKEDEMTKDMGVKGKGKSVGFQDEEQGREQEHDLSLQISPRRLGQEDSTGTSGNTKLPETAAAISSASSNPNTNHNYHGELLPGGSVDGGPASSTAHDLLRTIVQDVMYDFQRETKAEMVGLHLDLLRMGRGWRNELRTLMDEYVGDLRELREENQRLRMENERLKRGY